MSADNGDARTKASGNDGSATKCTSIINGGQHGGESLEKLRRSSTGSSSSKSVYDSTTTPTTSSIKGSNNHGKRTELDRLLMDEGTINMLYSSDANESKPLVLSPRGPKIRRNSTNSSIKKAKLERLSLMRLHVYQKVQAEAQIKRSTLGKSSASNGGTTSASSLGVSNAKKSLRARKGMDYSALGNTQRRVSSLGNGKAGKSARLKINNVTRKTKSVGNLNGPASSSNSNKITYRGSTSSKKSEPKNRSKSDITKTVTNDDNQWKNCSSRGANSIRNQFTGISRNIKCKGKCDTNSENNVNADRSIVSNVTSSESNAERGMNGAPYGNRSCPALDGETGNKCDFKVVGSNTCTGSNATNCVTMTSTSINDIAGYVIRKEDLNGMKEDVKMMQNFLFPDQGEIYETRGNVVYRKTGDGIGFITFDYQIPNKEIEPPQVIGKRKGGTVESEDDDEDVLPINICCDRTESLPSFDLKMMEDFKSVLEKFETDPHVKVIVWNTSSGNAYSHGFPESDHTKSVLRSLLLQLQHCRKLLVGSFNGECNGFSLILLCLSDLVYASEKSYFSVYNCHCELDPHYDLFNHFYPNHSVIKSMLYTGKKLTALEAYTSGIFITDVLWPGKFHQEVTSKLKHFLNFQKNGQMSIEGTKAKYKKARISNSEMVKLLDMS